MSNMSSLIRYKENSYVVKNLIENIEMRQRWNEQYFICITMTSKEAYWSSFMDKKTCQEEFERIINEYDGNNKSDPKFEPKPDDIEGETV